MPQQPDPPLQLWQVNMWGDSTEHDVTVLVIAANEDQAFAIARMKRAIEHDFPLYEPDSLKISEEVTNTWVQADVRAVPCVKLKREGVVHLRNPHIKQDMGFMNLTTLAIEQEMLERIRRAGHTGDAWEDPLEGR